MKPLFYLSLTLLFMPLAPAAIPSTLKSEPHQRDSYNWQNRHRMVLDRHKETKPEYVMIGDSITHHWGGAPRDNFGAFAEGSWKETFAPHAVTNMGFGYDYIDNAYYRIENGELDGTAPRVIILLIGTNNLGHRKDTPQVCAAHAKALIELLEKKSPRSRILLLGILPRKEPELAEPIKKTNQLLSRMEKKGRVHFADLSKAFCPDGSSIPKNELMLDTVHLNNAGYKILGKQIAALLSQIDPLYSPAAACGAGKSK